MKVTDVYAVKEPNVEGDWYNVAVVYDGHMDVLPYLRTKEAADEAVTDLRYKAGLDKVKISSFDILANMTEEEQDAKVNEIINAIYGEEI